MNILFFAYYGFNPKNGGIDRVCNILTEEFTKLNHKVFFIRKKTGEKENNYTPLVEEVTLPDPDNVISEKAAEFFTEYVKSKKIDIIICQHTIDHDYISPYIAKQNTGAKLLYAIHTTPCIYSKQIIDTSCPILKSERYSLSKEWRRMFRILFKKQKIRKKDRKMGDFLEKLNDMGDGIVFLSEVYKEVAMRISNIKAPDKLFAINNPNTYNASEIKREKKENTILFIGRMEEEKSPEKALFIWKNIKDKFPDWNMKLLGCGPLLKEIEELAKKWKLDRLYIEGRQDPLPYYTKAKILILVSDYEGFPMVVPEAMQNGVIPIVFNSFEAAKDIIDDNRTGILVNSYNLNEFSEKLTALMSDEKKLMDMSEAARLSSERYDKSKIALQWIDLFNTLGKTK
jgi:hypothetical protein